MSVQTSIATNQAHLRTQTPQDRESRPLQDSHKTQGAIAFGGGLIAISLLLTEHQIVAVLVGILAVVLAWQFEEGPGYTYLGIWREDARLLRNDTVRANKSGYIIDSEVSDILDEFGTLLESEVDTVYFTFDGFRHANADPEPRREADILISEILKTTHAQTEEDLVTGSTMGERPCEPTDWANNVETHYVSKEYRNATSDLRQKVRTNPAELDKLLQKIADDPTFSLDAADAPAMQHENLGFAWNDIEQKGSKYWRLVWVCLERSAEWQAIRNSDPKAFTPEMLRKTELYRVFTALKQGLEAAGFINVRMMTHKDIERFIFSTWSARTNAEARASGHPAVLEQNIPKGDTEYSAFPLEPPKVSRAGIDTDGVKHTSLIVTKFDKKYVMPGGMFGLQAGLPRWTMMSVEIATASQRRDTWVLRYKKNQHQANIKRKYGNGYIPEQKDRDIEAEQAYRVDAIHRSGGRTVRMNVTFVVSALTYELLEERVDDLKAILRGQRVKVRRQRHPSLQLKYFKLIWGVRFR